MSGKEIEVLQTVRRGRPKGSKNKPREKNADVEIKEVPKDFETIPFVLLEFGPAKFKVTNEPYHFPKSFIATLSPPMGQLYCLRAPTAWGRIRRGDLCIVDTKGVTNLGATRLVNDETGHWYLKPKTEDDNDYPFLAEWVLIAHLRALDNED